MANVLVIDTATEICAVACMVAGQITENTRSVERLHNEQLLPMVRDLCQQASVSVREFEVVAFAAGPGSFTGIRIAAAAVQAFACAAQAQVLPLSSSAVLAAQAQRMSATPLLGVRTLLPSRRSHVYCCDYQLLDGVPHALGREALLEHEDVRVLPLPDGWRLVCSSVAIAAALPAAEVVHVGIEVLLAAACAAHLAGQGLPPAQALPRYVEGDTPWRPA